MKKKLLAALITVAMAGTCAAALAACNTTPSNDGSHDHDYEGVELTPIMNSDGTSEYHSRKCKVDGCNQSKDAAKHDYETVTTEATCTTAKSVKYTCKYCSYEKTEIEGEKLGHSWGEWEITAENMPAANKDGKATRSCTRQDCNAVDTTTLTVPQLWIDGKINPVYDNCVLKNTADCEHEGTATYTFVNSQNQVHIDFTGETPALGHDWNETLSSDDDNHFITCKRNPEHIKPDSTAAHTKKTTETASLKYNNQSGKWEHIYVTTCKDGCGYEKEFKGQEADLNDGGTDTALSQSVSGSGTHDSPFIFLAQRDAYTVTIPANTVVSLRYTNVNAMGVYAVLATDSDNLSVIYGNRVEAVAMGKRAKSDVYYGDRGGSLDFALTTTNGESATLKFKFFNNDTYFEMGSPSAVSVDTVYTDNVPEETDIRHTFAPASDGVYKFTVTGGMVYLEDGSNLVNAGEEFTEPLYSGKSYGITVSTNFAREAGTVTFKIERTGDITEPAPGTINRPIEISEAGNYEVEIKEGATGAFGKYYAFTPSRSGLYTFCDENSNVATYVLHSESTTGEVLANSMNNSDRAYKYITCELEAGTTYYLSVSSTENEEQTVNMTISVHQHEFKTEWTKNAYFHWNETNCGHDVIGSYGLHDFDGDDVCTVCGYEKVEVATEGLKYDLSSDGTYYIVSVGTATDVAISIPSVYGNDSLPVREIAANGFANKPITGITIPASITKIGANAFSGCNSLTSVFITDLEAWTKIVYDGYQAYLFYAQYNSVGCATDTKIYLNGVELVNVEIDGSVSGYAFANCSSIKTVTISGDVGTSAFAYCANLEKVTFNEGVSTIDGQAFYCCGKLTEISLPSTLTTVGSNAFSAKTSGTPKLPGPQISKITVADIAAYAKIDFPAAILVSGGKLYVGTTEVTSISATDLTGTTKIGKYAFANTEITSIDLTGVTTIGERAFYKAGLISVDLTGVTTIGNYAFRECAQLKKVIIGEGITAIGSGIFYNCSSLSTLVLPKSLETLTNSALNGCTALTNIYFLGTSEADLKKADGTTDKDWTTVSNVTGKTIYFYSEEVPTTEGNFWHYVDGVPTAYPATEVTE